MIVQRCGLDLDVVLMVMFVDENIMFNFPFSLICANRLIIQSFQYTEFTLFSVLGDRLLRGCAPDHSMNNPPTHLGDNCPSRYPE